MDKPCLITKAYVNTFLKRREKELHKGDCGRVLIAAGSFGMAGAAILCAKAALRSGAGLVRISAPKELFPILQVGVPEATCITRELTSDMWTAYDAVAIGPGLGKEEANEHLIEGALHCTEKVVVLDADGLNLLAENPLLAKDKRAQLIMTPHPGEAARLLRTTAAAVNKNRAESAAALAERFSCIAVLKGAGTLVAMPDGKTYINTTGNPGMATGGSGDVLTGIIAALAGQGVSALEAAAAGVYLHGLAGDLSAGQLGEYGLIASDLTGAVALALKATVN